MILVVLWGIAGLDLEPVRLYYKKNLFSSTGHLTVIKIIPLRVRIRLETKDERNLNFD